MRLRKRLVILGATGSIGSCALDVARAHPEEFQVVGISACRSVAKCKALAAEFGARAFFGADAALRAVEEVDADICVVAVVGASGLRPTLAAIEKGMDIALATKEVLVMAGGLVMAKVRRHGVRLLPIDSEHSAIFQCLASQMAMEGKPRGVSRLTLTASGGPFLDSPADLSSVTLQDALRHPCWKMGQKVTVEAATMMNKGFEAIEAHWLFDVPMDGIDVVVHPECVIHSLVTFVDGSTLAQLSAADMRIAVQYALTHPGRLASRWGQPLDLAALGGMTFRRPDANRFPCLGLAMDAFRAGGGATAVLAAADEWAVQKFLDGKISYLDMVRAIEECLEVAPRMQCDSMDEVLAAGEWTRRHLEATWKL